MHAASSKSRDRSGKGARTIPSLQGFAERRTRRKLKTTDWSIDLLKARITAMEARQIIDARAASPPINQGYNRGGSAAAFPYEEVCIRLFSGDVIGHQCSFQPCFSGLTLDKAVPEHYHCDVAQQQY